MTKSRKAIVPEGSASSSAPVTRAAPDAAESGDAIERADAGAPGSRPRRTEHVCPICARSAPRRLDSGDANPTFPFCSAPCKLVDLGHWLDGAYRVAGPEGPTLSPEDDE